VYIKKTSINSISLYVLTKESLRGMADATMVGEIVAENPHQAVDAAWLRLLGKF
jgi:hypothetical protein